jgi:hypothetical protein
MQGKADLFGHTADEDLEGKRCQGQSNLARGSRDARGLCASTSDACGGGIAGKSTMSMVSTRTSVCGSGYRRLPFFRMLIRRSQLDVAVTPIHQQRRGVQVRIMKWAGLKADVAVRRRTLCIEGTPTQSPLPMPRVVDVSCRDHDAVLSQRRGSTIQPGGGANFQNLDSRRRSSFTHPAQSHFRPLERSNPYPVDEGGCPQSRELVVDEATLWQMGDTACPTSCHCPTRRCSLPQPASSVATAPEIAVRIQRAFISGHQIPLPPSHTSSPIHTRAARAVAPTPGSVARARACALRASVDPRTSSAPGN